MKKISLIITGALLALATNLTLAQESNSFSNGKWSAKLGLDVATEDGLDKGLMIGAVYSDYNKNINMHYNFGIALTSGRNDTCYSDICDEVKKLSLDGIIFSTNLIHKFEDNYVVFGGLNYASISSTTSVTVAGRDTAIKLSSDGIGYQVGVGVDLSKQINLQIIRKSIPFKSLVDAEGSTFGGTGDLETTQLAINYSF
jgi:hypothetical protein